MQSVTITVINNHYHKSVFDRRAKLGKIQGGCRGSQDLIRGGGGGGGGVAINIKFLHNKNIHFLEFL